MSLLFAFELITGLRVNLRKNLLVLTGVLKNWEELLLMVLTVFLVTFLILYLGVLIRPLGPINEDFDAYYLVDRKKISRMEG